MTRGATGFVLRSPHSSDRNAAHSCDVNLGQPLGQWIEQPCNSLIAFSLGLLCKSKQSNVYHANWKVVVVRHTDSTVGVHPRSMTVTRYAGLRSRLQHSHWTIISWLTCLAIVPFKQKSRQQINKPNKSSALVECGFFPCAECVTQSVTQRKSEHPAKVLACQDLLMTNWFTCCVVVTINTDSTAFK